MGIEEVPTEELLEELRQRFGLFFLVAVVDPDTPAGALVAYQGAAPAVTGFLRWAEASYLLSSIEASFNRQEDAPPPEDDRSLEGMSDEEWRKINE
jgi:hypothetical protein